MDSHATVATESADTTLRTGSGSASNSAHDRSLSAGVSAGTHWNTAISPIPSQQPRAMVSSTPSMNAGEYRPPTAGAARHP